MAGPGGQYNQAQASQLANSQAQTQIAQEQNQLQKENYGRMLELQQPLISKEQALSTGDAQEALRAAAPELGVIAGGYQAAKDNIYNTVPAGPARDYALANLERGKATNISSVLAQQVSGAPEVLANIGSGFGAFSLQELGASLSGYGGSNQGYQNVAQNAVQAQANQLGFLGGLANLAGSFFQPIKLSDRRLKLNISPLGSVLRRIVRMPVVTYEYKHQAGVQEIGVIAQEAKPLFPQAVKERDGWMVVDYGALASLAIQAIQEQQAQIEELRRTVESLKSNIGQVVHG